MIEEAVYVIMRYREYAFASAHYYNSDYDYDYIMPNTSNYYCAIETTV